MPVSHRFRWVTTVVLVLSSLLAGTALAGEELWLTNFDSAKTKAKAEKKLLLVDFTGSDWCGWCIKLKQEVFDKEEFKKEAPKQFVLVELDYPRTKKLSDDLKEQNDKLAKQYKVRGFPTILMLDAEGQVVARTGYRPGGPEKYVGHLADFVKVYETIPPMREELKKAQGVDRAKLLDRLIETYAKLDNEADETESWSKEIVSLDPENKAGLKVKYEYRLLMAEAAGLKEAGKFAEAKLALDKAVALPGLAGDQKQDAYFAQGECYFQQKDFSGVVACLKKAVEAAPDSPKAAGLQNAVKRFSGAAEAQEAIVKVKADLEKAEGIQRARLLDQLVDARTKLMPYVPDRDGPKEIEKLSKEIIALDPENKAGLKGKYEFRVLLAEAATLSRAQKIDEARAVLDKALAIPGLQPDQVQEALFLKGTGYLVANETEKGLECLKKALEAAPKGVRATLIENYIRRAEDLVNQKKAAKEEAK